MMMMTAEQWYNGNDIVDPMITHAAVDA